jgi:hypothetical protein
MDGTLLVSPIFPAQRVLPARRPWFTPAVSMPSSKLRLIAGTAASTSGSEAISARNAALPTRNVGPVDNRTMRVGRPWPASPSWARKRSW